MAHPAHPGTTGLMKVKGKKLFPNQFLALDFFAASYSKTMTFYKGKHKLLCFIFMVDPFFHSEGSKVSFIFNK